MSYIPPVPGSVKTEEGLNSLLPQSESLNIRAFSDLFSVMSQSYKLYWFRGILEGVRLGKREQTFSEIIRCMAVDAWKPVVKYHLRLGLADALERLALALKAESGLPEDAEEDRILSAMENSRDPEIRKLQVRLSQYVPYRLQAPFFQGGWKFWDDNEMTVEKINSEEGMIYSIVPGKGLGSMIRIRPEWYEYLSAHLVTLTLWSEGHLAAYLKKQNPGAVVFSTASENAAEEAPPPVTEKDNPVLQKCAESPALAATKLAEEHAPVKPTSFTPAVIARREEPEVPRKGRKVLSPRQKLWRRIKREFPKKKLIGDIVISDEEFELLVQELCNQHRRLIAQPEQFEVDEVFCVALVQFGIRFYDDGAYWPFIEERVNPGYFKAPHRTQFGNAFLEFMRKSGKLLNEDKKAMSNILLHGFVSDHKSGDLFDFLYAYYSIDLARDIEMLSREAMSALIENIKTNDGRKRTYNLVEHTSDAVRLNERGCKTRLRRYLKMIDQAFWNPEAFSVRSGNRLMRRFAEWWDKDEEKIERDRAAGGRSFARHRSGWKPYLKYDFEKDWFSLVLPARLVRGDEEPRTYWTVRCSEWEQRIEAAVNPAVTGFVTEEMAVPLKKQDLFGVFETQFYSNGERLSRWKIQADPIRFFDIDGYFTEPAMLRPGNMVSFSAEDYVPVSEALYLKEPWDGVLRCSYQFEDGDLIVFPDKKVLNIGKKLAEGLLKRGLQSGVYGMREEKKYPVYAAAPSLFARILPRSMNGTQLRVNGTYHRLFDDNGPRPGVLVFDLQERVPEEGVHIALNRFGVGENGLYHVELDIPNDHADRRWDFLLINGVEYSFDEAPYIFVETGVLCVPETTGLRKFDPVISEEREEGQLRFAFTIPEEDEYFRLCLDDIPVAFEIPRLSYRFQGEEAWRSSLQLSIWHKDLPDIVEVRYPADKLTILLDEEGNDDEDNEQHIQSYARNQEKGFFVCDLHPFRSWYGRRVATRRLYVKLPGMKEKARFLNIYTKDVFVSAVLSADLKEDVIHGEFDIVGKAPCYADLWFGDALLLEKEPIVNGRILARTEVVSGIYKVDIYESDTEDDGFDDPVYDLLASRTMELINPANLTGSHIEVKQLIRNGTDSYLRLKRSYTLYDMQPIREMGKGYYSGHMVVREREYGHYRYDYDACVHIPDPEELTKAYLFTLDEYGDEQSFIYDNDRHFIWHEEVQTVSGVFKYRRFVYLWEDEYTYRIEFVEKPDRFEETLEAEREERRAGKQKQAEEEKKKDQMRNEDALCKPIASLGLSVRAYNALRRGGIGTSTELYARAILPGGLFRIRNMGARQVEECVNSLRKAGYSI